MKKRMKSSYKVESLKNRNNEYMETQKSIKDAVELCALLDKIEAQIYNIGTLIPQHYNLIFFIST